MIFTLILMGMLIVLANSCKKDSNIQTLTIGQSYQGGIIFYLDNSKLHGLICAANDQSNGIKWQLEPVFATNVTATAIGTGKNNTALLVSLIGNGNYAAKLCDDLVLNGYSDWFLPSKDEIDAMRVNLAGTGIGNFDQAMGHYYWSSSEIDIYNKWAMCFGSGDGSFSISTLNGCNVRAIRAF